MRTKPAKAHVMIYRAVDGAVRNVAHHHPKWNLQHRDVARSIAKRATGTLTAEWPDVLAARMVPSDVIGLPGSGQWPPFRSARKRGGRGASVANLRRSPHSLRNLWNEVSSLIGPAKRAGQHERVEAFVAVLRIIDARINGTYQQSGDKQ